MELGGLEPPPFWLPARRSSQLSYSPFEVEAICKVNTCLLTIASCSQTKVDLPNSGNQCRGEQEAAIELSAVDRQEIDFVLGVLA